ncbi:MAG: protein kinase [Chloroflexota bacterium]
MDDFKQQVIKGYQLNQLIGSGGFGAVYKAHQSVIEREVAIKVILPHHANDPHFIRNFESEAQLIARLEHPYIVPLYDFWRDPNGAYLVMRYYPAGNLSQYIHQAGALDEATIARMMEQIGSALDVAHANQIIHRDIKPANILLDTSGNAYLSDFGLAEDISGDEDSADIVGSPAYLPPEIIQNIPPSPQSDLYSLGFVLYEMLTGAYAFAEITPDSSIMSIFDFHLNEVIPDNPMLSDAVNLVIQRATAKDPQDRYPSGLALAHAFREAIEYEGESTTYSTPSEYIINPFKGLRAFDEADEMTFFGRDKLVKRLLQRLDDKSQNENFLALVGPSGSGKSSVVHAGLVPALRRGELEGSDEWFILDMVPSANPFTQLVATLRSISLDPLASAERELQASPDALVDLLPKVIPTQDDHLLLVIDQFEELFTQTTDVTIRKQFLDLLYHSLQSEQFYLVIMLRADFYDRPMLHEGFGELIQARTQVVLPLTSMELTDVITKPALHAGLDMENELTTAIIADVQAEAVSLPLLQYALTEVFEHREQNRLTLEGYEAIGGIAGALAYRADEVYEQLSQEHQALARQLFLRFVTLGEGTEDTRRRVRQTELLSIAPNAADLQSVLDAFGNARLLTFDNDEQTREPTVEVAHETLIREWTLLRDWLDDSRDDIRRQRMLNATVKQWRRANYDASYLLRGTQLIEVEAWRTRSSIILTEDELRFISESQAQRERLVQKEHEAQAEKERLQKQSTQRLQFLMVGAVVAAIIAIGLSLFAFNQANVAQDAQSTAEFNRQQAEDNQATAIASQHDAELAADASLSNALASAAQQAYALGQEQVALALALDSVNFSPDILNQDGNLATNTLLEISRAPGLIYEETPVDFPISSMITL